MNKLVCLLSKFWEFLVKIRDIALAVVLAIIFLFLQESLETQKELLLIILLVAIYLFVSGERLVALLYKSCTAKPYIRAIICPNFGINNALTLDLFLSTNSESIFYSRHLNVQMEYLSSVLRTFQPILNTSIIITRKVSEDPLPVRIPIVIDEKFHNEIKGASASGKHMPISILLDWYVDIRLIFMRIPVNYPKRIELNEYPQVNEGDTK